MRKFIFLSALTIFFCCSILQAQDPVKVAPNIYKNIFENDRVRVCEVSIKAGEKIGMHSHPAHLAYALTPAKLQMKDSTGKSQVAEVKQGDVVWFEPVTHEAENLGADAKLIVVELKK